MSPPCSFHLVPDHHSYHAPPYPLHFFITQIMLLPVPLFTILSLIMPLPTPHLIFIIGVTRSVQCLVTDWMTE
jgi:hypothetical protein